MQRRATARVRREEASIADAVLAWYDRERRRLPWRAEPGEAPDPYRVWLSEIMLQQTTVKAVLPRYDLFLRRWPDVTALARAELGEVLAAWAGLGYYARARNLHACARAVAEQHGGKFPEDEAGLRKLPGIGDYTAAAIAAIAFGKRATPVDGNIERVVARLFAVTTPLPAAKTEIRALAETLTPEERSGDFAQAMMDLGRHDLHAAPPGLRSLPGAARLPGLCRRARRGAALSRGEGRAAGQARRDLRRHPRRRRGAAARAAAAWPAGRHAGNAVIALGRGRARPKSLRADTRRSRPTGASCPASSSTPSRISISSFRVYRAEVGQDAQPKRAAEPERCRWLKPRELAGAALPSVMRKVLLHALAEQRVSPAARASPAPPRARRRSA